MRIATLLGAAMVVGFCAAPGSAYACSCTPQSVETAYVKADALFEGRVVSLTYNRERMYDDVRFAVAHTWKGAGAEEISVRTGGDGMSCGIRFEQGRDYLVYAAKDEEGTWWTGLCSFTKPLEFAGGDLAALRAGVEPLRLRLPPSPPPTPPPPRTPEGPPGECPP